jgi:hypothetical protein
VENGFRRLYFREAHRRHAQHYAGDVTVKSCRPCCFLGQRKEQRSVALVSSGMPKCMNPREVEGQGSFVVGTQCVHPVDVLNRFSIAMGG